MSKKSRKHIYITGKVQGVGFRAFTRRQAQKYDIKGWVKNLSDGRVEVVLEGDNLKVKELIDKLKKGPSFAFVHQLEVKNEEYRNEFDRFSIKY